jgi:PAS domain S-box-containing protein
MSTAVDDLRIEASERCRVLIVEDDTDTRENLVDILALDGIQTETASTMNEALEPRDWNSMCAVVLDRKLPDGDASRLLPKLNQLAPEAAIIVVTGYADLDGAISALRHGATDYLIKPVNADAIRAAIARVVEQRRMKSALLATEDRLRAALENSSIGCFSQDAELRYTWAYKPFGGLPAVALIGKTDRDLFREEEADELERLKRHVLDSGQAVRQEVRLTVDGAPRWYDLAVERQHQAKTLGINCVVVDITESKQTQERLLQQERLAAIGETMAGLVHEGRNALQRSKACLEMLALDVKDRPEALDLVRRVEQAQEHLQQLYEQVREYAAPVVLSRARVSLVALWREVWEQLAQAWRPRGIRLEERLVDGELPGDVDPFRLGQVLRNILENAIEVSPSGGTITISGTARWGPQGAAVRISIRDQGPGIRLDIRGQVFKAFFTTKAKGTGLGMAISQRIVRAHGGTLEIGDTQLPGAEFIITLPQG